MELSSRVGVSPMCQYSAKEGVATNHHIAHYGQFALHRVDLIFTESSAVSDVGRISVQDLCLYNDEHQKGHKSIVDLLHSYSSKVGCQLNHAGRKALTKVPWKSNFEHSETILAPSPIPWSESSKIPKELTKLEISEIICEFKNSAKRANEAGYDLLEIHAAHGYLISEFLSPITNQRNDCYGGVFENRIRFLLEVLSAVQTVWPERKPLGVRISCTDWMENGWNIEDSCRLALVLSTKGVDFIDCSAGLVTSEQNFLPKNAGQQCEFAEKIKKTLSGSCMKVFAVGQLTEFDQVQNVIESGQADVVLVGREFLRKPSWIQEAADYFNIDRPYIPQYLRAKK